MTVPQFTAFLVWYKTGLEGTGKTRSFRKTCKLTKHGLPTIVAWAEDFGWEELAKQKDAEIQAELEDVLISSILEDKKAILKRQRTLMSKMYGMIYKALESMEIKFADVIKLLEYESGLSGAGAGRVGENLFVLMQNLPSEDRIAIMSHYRELRDNGGFRGAGMGSLGPLESKTRN